MSSSKASKKPKWEKRQWTPMSHMKSFSSLIVHASPAGSSVPSTSSQFV